MTSMRFIVSLGVALALATGNASLVHSQTRLDTPALTVGKTGMTKVEMTVQAGPSGAPAGFTVWWMKESDFIANGSTWFPNHDPRQGEARFDGTPTLNVFPGEASSFKLGPDQSITIEVGDLADETGVTSSGWRPRWDGELESGTQYVFCAFANASGTTHPSGLTGNTGGQTIQTQDCTYTIGFWMNHPELWPSSCDPMQLGSNFYSAADLMTILNTQPQGNGAVSMAHQLIAAKLNLCQGANPTAVQACINTADALLSGCGADKLPPFGTCNIAPGTTSSVTQCLDDYNNGLTGPGHCLETPAKTSTWGRLKTVYR